MAQDTQTTVLTKLRTGSESASTSEADSVATILKLEPITTAQRDAISAEKGMVIYNSDTNALESYNGTAWA